MKYKLNTVKREWQTSTVIFMGIIIVALAVSLFLSMLANIYNKPVLACKEYQYDVYTRKICLIPEDDLR